MPKNEELSEFIRGKILGLHEGGKSVRDIAKKLKIPRSTVQDTISRYKNLENVKSASRSGRPKALDELEQNKLKVLVKTNNRMSANMIQKKFAEENYLVVSTKTIRRSLHSLGIFSRVAAVKPRVTEKQRENRLKWCLSRRRWSVAQWGKIIWSDESRFTIFRSDGPHHVWRSVSERYNIENITPSVKHGGGGIMVWGCFSEKGLGPLFRVEGTMDRHDYIEILENKLLPYISDKFNSRGYAFQDDNAPVHTARDVQKWIKEKKIKTLPDWPSQSPDLNPIEHLWSELGRRLDKRAQYPKNANELEAALQEEWSNIPYEVYHKLIESMPRRIEACISSNGWPTRY